MGDALTAWMKSGKYLPRFMRDFHDQKDVFKAIHGIVDQNPGTKAISWVDAQIYVIDVFLWFMALRGYTLQRTRKDLPFRDVEDTVKAFHDGRRAAIFAALHTPTATEQKE